MDNVELAFLPPYLRPFFGTNAVDWGVNETATEARSADTRRARIDFMLVDDGWN